MLRTDNGNQNHNQSLPEQRQRQRADKTEKTALPPFPITKQPKIKSHNAHSNSQNRLQKVHNPVLNPIRPGIITLMTKQAGIMKPVMINAHKD